MKLESYNPSILKDTFEAISHIIDECELTCTADGITINALDKSHITFIQLEYHKTLFDEYQAEDEQLLVDTNELMKILKRCKNNDILIFETDNHNLIITMKGDSTKQFKLRLIDQEYQTPVPPTIDYPVGLEVPSELIKDSLDDCNIYGENIVFTVDEDYLHICSSTSDGLFGDTHIKYIHGENIHEVVRSSYSIEKLKDIFRASKVSKTCTLLLGDSLPLTVKFKLPSDDGEVGFLLAPRIEA